MGLMDELKKLTQPYEDEDDFFEGADPSFKSKPKPKAEVKPTPVAAQKTFEAQFNGSAPSPEPAAEKPAQSEGGGFASIFGNLGAKKEKAPKPPRQNFRERANIADRDTQVMLFSPKSFDEAGDLVGYMLQNATVVMTLEGVPTDLARRLLDFMSGIAFALQGKITPVSAKTYFVTPQNVDVMGAQPEQPESAGHYF